MKKKNLILIVDDDEDDRFLIQSAFQDAQLPTQLQFFENGESLLSFMTNSPSIVPNAILMDINMPGQSGLETLQMLRQSFRVKSIPVIMLSTTSAVHEIEEVYKCGANSFVSKPASYEGLKQLVNQIYCYWVETNLTY